MSLWTAMMVLDLVMTGDQVIGSILDAADASKLLEQQRLTGELNKIASQLNSANIDFDEYMSNANDARSRMQNAVSRMAPVGTAYNKLKNESNTIRENQSQKMNEFSTMSKNLYNTQKQKEAQLAASQTKQMTDEGRGAIYKLVQKLTGED